MRNTLSGTLAGLGIGAVLFLSIAAGMPPAAGAATGLKIQPIKVSHTIEPGGSVSGFIELTNESGGDVNVELSVEDFVPAHGSAKISFVDRAEGNTTVRDWISFGVERNFSFTGGKRMRVPYTIEAPPDAEPGGHFGVLFFKAHDPTQTGSLRVSTRVGTLVYVTVPGNRLQKGEIHGFSAPLFVSGPPVSFTMEFENTGTVHFEPKGEVTITNMFGKEIGSVPIEGQVVLPGGVRDIEARWQHSALLLGWYTARAQVSDGEGNELTSNSVSFGAAPVWYLVGFIGAVLIIFFILKFVRRNVSISIKRK